MFSAKLLYQVVTCRRTIYEWRMKKKLFRLLRKAVIINNIASKIPTIVLVGSAHANSVSSLSKSLKRVYKTTVERAKVFNA